MKVIVELPKKVKERLEEIKAQFNFIYYKDKLDICNIIYDDSVTSEQLWEKVNRYAGYRIYEYEPTLLDEHILGERKMAQIRLLHELAIGTL